MTWKRVATAVVLIPGVVALVLWGTTAGVAVGLALIIELALFEFFALGNAIGHRAYRFWTAACAFLLVFVQWWAASIPSLLGPAGMPRRFETIQPGYARIPEFLLRFPPAIPDVLFLFLLGVALLTLATKRPVVEGLPAAGMSSSSLLLIALPLSYAVRLEGAGYDGPSLLLFVLILTWVGDTAAYFVGRSIGKHRLAPLLSPKKTWEGTVASFIGSLVVAYVFRRFVNISLTHLLGMAAVANIAGQAGDLLESAYKRSAGVKDSGTLLPGHGGILDRIDALILAFPVVWYYWIWVYLPSR
ncbi:MAG TPA: phosphatidate cytidylyltransferase [Candidatus Acidoferrum sp.]|nr:phosphatidate cytidylyltransferase [Candidatus Acidoferrum sp.]